MYYVLVLYHCSNTLFLVVKVGSTTDQVLLDSFNKGIEITFVTHITLDVAHRCLNRIAFGYFNFILLD